MNKSIVINIGNHLGTRLSVSGAILMSFGYYLIAWIIWIFADAILIHHNHKIKEYSQRNMFAVFLLISIIGVYKLL
jgi:hypothetical protein